MFTCPRKSVESTVTYRNQRRFKMRKVVATTSVTRSQDLQIKDLQEKAKDRLRRSGFNISVTRSSIIGDLVTKGLDATADAEEFKTVVTVQQ